MRHQLASFTCLGHPEGKKLIYIRSPAVNRALCVLMLACFFLWIRFLLRWAFLFSRLILSGFSCLFRHTFKFKVSELFTYGCRVFSSRFSMLPLQQLQLYSQNISKQRYIYNGKYDILDQGSLEGIISPAELFVWMFVGLSECSSSMLSDIHLFH